MAPGKKKLVRAKTVGDWVRQGRIYLPYVSTGPPLMDYVDACVQFPHGWNDVWVNVMTQALTSAESLWQPLSLQVTYEEEPEENQYYFF
jgi:phage terminase large subunit-like protein